MNSLGNQSFSHFEVSLIDNGLPSESSAHHKVKLLDDRFHHHISDQNDGFAGGFYRGAQEAQTPYLMSLNPDTVLEEDCLQRLIDAIHQKDRPAMLCPSLLDMQTPERINGLGDSFSIFGIAWQNGKGQAVGTTDIFDREAVQVFGPSGAAGLYRTDVYQESGEMDPAFFCYLEDVDLALRIRAQGGRCLLIPNAIGYHWGGHSVQGQRGFPARLSARNGARLILKSAPLLLVLPMVLLYLIVSIWLIFREASTGQADKSRLAGLVQGLLQTPRSLAARTKRPAYPSGASFRIAKALSWRVSDVSRRKIRLWD